MKRRDPFVTLASIWLWAISFFTIACSDKITAKPCTLPSDCSVGQTCSAAGVCACTDDRGCPMGQTCDAAMGTCSKAKACAKDSECQLAEVCEMAQCLPGCRSGRDCPAATPICDTAARPHGACVECLTTSDCGDGYDCVAGACKKTCSGDADCPGAHCDPVAMVCVQCLESGHCMLGEVCVDLACTAGCEGDRDCPASTPVCAPGDGAHGMCYQCTGDAQCGADQKCRDHVCVAVCTSDSDCPGGACDPQTKQCVECVDKATCALGKICVAKACVVGCEEHRDCPTSTPICDPTSGTHGTCFQCVEDDDCTGTATCVDHVCQTGTTEMVDIPAGAFVMGSDADTDTDNPRHTVTLSAYAIDRTEVTNAQYKVCVTTGNCLAPSSTTAYNDPAKANYPVVYVSWEKAATYCAWASKRLPTEAEWEKAARGTDERTYPWGAAAPTCSLAATNSCTSAVTLVASYPSGVSPYGVHDMSGNAREWVSDWYATYPTGPATDPEGPASGSQKLARGGSWTAQAVDVTTFVRPTRDPNLSDDYIGFRCAKSATGPNASFTVTPPNGTVSTVFLVNASGSSDAQYPVAMLQVRWDWENDGTYDTTFSTTKTASHSFAAIGSYNIRVQVKSPAGKTATTTRKVVVGAGGGQGSPCAATSNCTGGYVCVTGGTCAEICNFLPTPSACENPGTTCTPTTDINGNLTFACL
jgi:formylglycine-generating enzyme required for sulfatase activity